MGRYDANGVSEVTKKMVGFWGMERDRIERYKASSNPINNAHHKQSDTFAKMLSIRLENL